VRLDQQNSVYVGFPGRGVGVITEPGDGPLATYFEPLHGFLPRLGGELAIVAQLRASNGSNVGGETVSLRITAADGTTIQFTPLLQLDGQGRVMVPIFHTPPGSVVHLHFRPTPDSSYGASEIHFAY
jgi:hypothetical protein